MDDVLWPLAALLVWAALLYKLRDLLREPTSLSLRLICAMLACVAVTDTLASPALYVAFDRLAGVPNLSALVMNACGMVFVLAVQRLLLHWVYPAEQARRRANWWQAFYILAFVAQVVLFVLAPVDHETASFVAHYAGTPFAREFILIVDVCLLLTLTDIARLCWRYAALAGRRFLRVGLRCTGFGALCGAIYFPLEAIHVVSVAAHITLIQADFLEGLFTVIGLGAALLISCGLTIPAWGPKLTAATAWIGRYRAYRRLHPLWLALYQASPDIALHTPTTHKDPLWINDLDYRLIRRVVEIRDGRLALRPHLSTTTAEHARHTAQQAGLHGTTLHATIEAATITDAIHTKRHHAPHPPPTSPPETTNQHTFAVQGGADLASETAWLGHVAQAMTRLRSQPWSDRNTMDSPAEATLALSQRAVAVAVAVASGNERSAGSR